MIHCQAALHHHFLKVSVAERVPQIPTQTQNNHFVPEMSAAEQRSTSDPFVSPYQTERQFRFATQPVVAIVAKVIAASAFGVRQRCRAFVQ